MGAVVLLQLAEFLLLLGNLCHEGLLKSHDGTGGAPPLEGGERLCDSTAEGRKARRTGNGQK